MKSFLTLYHRDDWHKENPVQNLDIRLMYAVWGSIAKQKKFEMYRASYDWFKDGYFTKAWRYNLRHGYWEKQIGKVRPSVLFDRAISFDKKTGEPDEEVHLNKVRLAQHIPMINQPEFTWLVDNKAYQAALFKDVMSPTYFAPPGSLITQPKGKRVVLKALGGLGGDYVSIIDKQRFMLKDRRIVQHFIDGRVNGQVQDFRVHFVGDRPQYMYTRVAPPGSYFTNVHLGASFYWLKPEDAQEVWDLAQQVVRRLSMFNRKFFCLDFMINAKTNKPMLIEINSTPGTAEFTVKQHEHLLSSMSDHLFGWDR